MSKSQVEAVVDALSLQVFKAKPESAPTEGKQGKRRKQKQPSEGIADTGAWD